LKVDLALETSSNICFTTDELKEASEKAGVLSLSVPSKSIEEADGVCLYKLP
jgi:hypothetical protein